MTAASESGFVDGLRVLQYLHMRKMHTTGKVTMAFVSAGSVARPADPWPMPIWAQSEEKEEGSKKLL